MLVQGTLSSPAPPPAKLNHLLENKNPQVIPKTTPFVIDLQFLTGYVVRREATPPLSIQNSYPIAEHTVRESFLLNLVQASLHTSMVV